MNLMLQNGQVEVMNIDPATGTITMAIHFHNLKQEDLQTLETKAEIGQRAQFACNYLRDEGFLDGNRGNQWRLAAGVVLHKS